MLVRSIVKLNVDDIQISVIGHHQLLEQRRRIKKDNKLQRLLRSQIAPRSNQQFTNFITKINNFLKQYAIIVKTKRTKCLRYY
jgi:hypothetical protein